MEIVKQPIDSQKDDSFVLLMQLLDVDGQDPSHKEIGMTTRKNSFD